MRLKISLNGNERLTENLILEVKAAASRLGLEKEIEYVEVIRQTSTARKVRKLASGRKRRARA